MSTLQHYEYSTALWVPKYPVVQNCQFSKQFPRSWNLYAETKNSYHRLLGEGGGGGGGEHSIMSGEIFHRLVLFFSLAVGFRYLYESLQRCQLQLPLKCSQDDHLPFACCPVSPNESVVGWWPNSLVCQLLQHTCWFCLLSGYILCQKCRMHCVHSILILPSRRTHLTLSWQLGGEGPRLLSVQQQTKCTNFCLLHHTICIWQLFHYFSI